MSQEQDSSLQTTKFGGIFRPNAELHSMLFFTRRRIGQKSVYSWYREWEPRPKGAEVDQGSQSLNLGCEDCAVVPKDPRGGAISQTKKQFFDVLRSQTDGWYQTNGGTVERFKQAVRAEMRSRLGDPETMSGSFSRDAYPLVESLHSMLSSITEPQRMARNMSKDGGGGGQASECGRVYGMQRTG